MTHAATHSQPAVREKIQDFSGFLTNVGAVRRRAHRPDIMPLLKSTKQSVPLPV
jgi:hypothetical protein